MKVDSTAYRAYQRMLTRCVADGECLVWTGARNPDGYGRKKVGGRSAMLVHRLAYEVEVGPIPAGMEVDHLCFNRACVCIEHLEAVTTKVNAERRAARQTHCKHGHEFTPENTYRGRRDRRECRICHAARERVRYRNARK